MQIERIEWRIELTPQAKLCLDILAERDGMKQKVVLSRLVEWFTCQPDAIQAVVLGRAAPGMAPDVARLILQRLGETQSGTRRLKEVPRVPGE